ncbi:MAG TPA: SLC13 family permease [Planctomycetota bacterium]|nr:SLC13 family permease [Planctomycetota bacterium]
MDGALSTGEVGSPAARRVGGVLGALLFAGALFLPGLPLDVAQRRMAAVTLLTAVLWLSVAVPVGAASLVPLALLPLLGVLPAGQAAQLYMHDLVTLFLGAFLVALGLERWGVHRRLALLVIARVGTRPQRLVLGFMLAGALLSAWINNTATALMMLPIGVSVIQTLGAQDTERDARFAPALLLGMAYACSMGGLATPIGTAPNQSYLGIFQAAFPDAPRIGFGAWCLLAAPLMLVFVLAGWWLLTRVVLRLRPGAADAREIVRRERERLGPLDPAGRRMGLVFGLTALLWITRADLEVGDFTLPGWGAWLADLLGADVSYVSDATVAIAMGLVCFAIPSGTRPGEALLDWRTTRKIPWEVLLLIGSGFCLARGFQVSGLDAVLGGLLGPWIEGKPLWLVVGAVVLMVTFLTEVTSNTATTNVLLPVLAQAAVAAGIDPRATMLPATFAASCAFMLPVATPPNAVVYSTGLVPIPTMARVGLAFNVLSVLLIPLVFLVWGLPLLGIDGSLPEWARP